MENDKINIEEELKYMNVYKSDDPSNYFIRSNDPRLGNQGQVLICYGNGRLEWIDDNRSWQERLQDG